MSRTILEIAQEAAERENTAPAPAQLFDTNNKTARVLRIAAKDTMRDFMRRQVYRGYSEMHSTWVFNTAPNVHSYRLPPDFLRLIPGTEQRHGWALGLIGPATPQVWANWIYGSQVVAAPMGWRIKNGALSVQPTPSAYELVAIEYISRYMVVADLQEGDLNLATYPIQVNQPLVARDGFLTLEDPDLIIPPNPDQGIYQEADALEDDEGGELQDDEGNPLTGDDDGGVDGDLGWDDGVWGQEPEDAMARILPHTDAEPPMQVRKEFFTADTDRCALDDDYLLSLGMTFRLQRALGKAYQEHYLEYEEAVADKIEDDAGGARGFSFGHDRENVEVVPLGGGDWIVS